MKRFLTVLLAMFGLSVLMIVLAMPAMASYSSKVDEFIKTTEWKHYTVWDGDQQPTMPGNNQYWGCAAYACDFVRFVWGIDSYNSVAQFYSPSEIRDGDVIRTWHWGKDDKGNAIEISHFYVVIQRKQDGSFYTTEGNFFYDGAARVRLSETAYSINNLGGDRFDCGWHNPNYEIYVPNQAPNGYFDSVTSAGPGRIRVTGWAKDPDTPNQPINVHIYVGGEANPNVPCYSITANQYRSDVGSCAFDATIPVAPYGTQQIYVYALDSAGGNNPVLNGSPKTVTIERDTEAPVISNIQITDVSWKGYTVTCDVSDNVKVDKVAFPTWTVNDGQDDMFANWDKTALGTIKDGKATYRVNTTDHGKQTNCVYRMHIYAYDAAGNWTNATQSTVPELDVDVPSPITNVKVTYISQQGYTVSCDVDTAWNIQKVEFPTWTENNDQDDLIWHTGTVSNGHASFNVLTSDHNNEKGCYYRTHIYVWDPDGNWAYVSQRHFEALRVRVPDDIATPTITNFVENGNTVHLEWTESPLIDEEDVRSYTIRVSKMMQDPTLEITDIHALSADLDFSCFGGSETLVIEGYAVNDTTGDESQAAFKKIDCFCGEFMPPERITMNDGETMNCLGWLSQIDDGHGHGLAIRCRFDEYIVTSSDESIVSVVPDDSYYGAKALVAHKPGEVTLTLEFVNQPNTRRTTVLQVLPSENTVMTLPASLKIIEDEAFLGTTLKIIAIPEGCTTIGSRAFAESSELKRIYIPASVTNIEFDAFEGSDNLTICAPDGSRAIKIAMALDLPYEISE